MSKIFRLTFLLFATLHPLIARSQARLPQVPVPSLPQNAIDDSQCDRFQAQVSDFKSQIIQEHEACLASSPNTRPGTQGPGQCSAPACQTLHDYAYGNAGDNLDQDVAACRLSVARYQQRQVAEQTAIQNMQDVVGALMSNAPVPAMASQDDLETFDQQIEQEAVAGDQAEPNLSLGADVAKIAAPQDTTQAGSGLDLNAAVEDAMSNDSEHPLQREVASTLDDVVDQVPVGKEVQLFDSNLQAYSNLQSDDPVKQVDGANQIAQNVNDQFNSNPISKKVTSYSLNIIKVYQTRMAQTLNLIQSAVSPNCLLSVNNSDCPAFNEQFDKIWNQPVVTPANSLFDNQ